MALSQNTLKKIRRLLKGRLLEIFTARRRQRHAKINFGDDGKRETSNRQQPFAVGRKPDAKGLYYRITTVQWRCTK